MPISKEAQATSAIPRWFRPGVFILVPVAMSFTAWSALAAWRNRAFRSGPFEKLAGWPDPSPIEPKGIVLLVMWYAAMFAVATVGWRIGCAGRPPAPTLMAVTTNRQFEKRYFLLISVIATVGVGYTYAQIASATSILGALTSQQANAFSQSISQSAGIGTLRYAPILAAPLGVYLWRKKAIGWPMMVAAVVLLLLDAIISSRLSLLMATVVYLVIWVKNAVPSERPGTRRRRWMAIIAVLVIGFSLLAALNYFRNANYYRDVGVTSPVAMNFFQMGAYLSVPAQVQLGSSAAIMLGTWEKTGDPVDSINAIEPTFLQFNKVTKDNSWKGAEVYGYSASFGSSFFTNSVFADIYSDFGAWGWFYTFFLYGFCGYLLAKIVRFGTVIAASGGVLAYCFAEVWRIQIVSYGFVIFLLLSTVAAAVIAARWPFSSKSKADTDMTAFAGTAA